MATPQQQQQYVQRFEFTNDGAMDIHEVLPDEEDGVLSPTGAAAHTRDMRHSPPQEPTGYHSYYHQHQQQDPPGVHAAVSYPESTCDISVFGDSFDQVFDMEVSNVPTGKSWDEMRLLFLNPSGVTNSSTANNATYANNTGDDQATAKSACSSKSGSRRARSRSSSFQLPPADSGSDLDQVFEELTELQETEEKFLQHISAFRANAAAGRQRAFSSASGSLHGGPLCSWKEEDHRSLEEEKEQENDSGSSNGSHHRNSALSRKSIMMYEDDGLLPPSKFPLPPPPLSNISKLNHQELYTRKTFISSGGSLSSNTELLSEKDAHLLATRFPVKDDDDDTTALTSVLTQSTYSYPPPPIAIAPMAARKEALPSEPEEAIETTISFSPGSPADILHDMDRFLHRVENRRKSTLSEEQQQQNASPPRTTSLQRDSFDSPTTQRISIATTKSIRERPYKSALSELMEASKNVDTVKNVTKKEKVPESRDGDEEEPLSESSTVDDTNSTDEDNTTIATVSEKSNDEDRLKLNVLETSILSRTPQAIDSVLKQEYGVWYDMAQWDKNPDKFTINLDITNMRSPSGCMDAPSIFQDKNMSDAIDEILQNRGSETDADDDDDDSAVSSLTDHSIDRISIHDDEIDVQIVSSKDETSEETSTTNAISAPEMASS
ncbi:MAG: hypothetical protein SGILL_002581, partial [Bacillariaceae sp.]